MQLIFTTTNRHIKIIGQGELCGMNVRPLIQASLETLWPTGLRFHHYLLEVPLSPTHPQPHPDITSLCSRVGLLASVRSAALLHWTFRKPRAVFRRTNGANRCPSGKSISAMLGQSQARQFHKPKAVETMTPARPRQDLPQHHGKMQTQGPSSPRYAVFHTVRMPFRNSGLWPTRRRRAASTKMSRSYAQPPPVQLERLTAWV